MDTHTASQPLDRLDRPSLSARLPGEPGDDSLERGVDDRQSASASAPPSSPTPPSPTPLSPTLEPAARLPRSGAARAKRRRPWLIGASGLVLAVFGGGLFLVSPYNHVMPVPRFATTVQQWANQAVFQLPTPVAPSAKLAGVIVPSTATPVIRPPYKALPRAAEVNEILALDGGRSGAAATPPVAPPAKALQRSASVSATAVRAEAPEAAPQPLAVQGMIPPAYTPHEPGLVVAQTAPTLGSTTHTVPAFAASDVTGPVIASLEPTPKVVVSPRAPALPATHSAATPAPVAQVGLSIAGSQVEHDPVAVAMALRAGPMSSSDEVNVYQLVTEMGAIMKDIRTQDAQLRGEVQTSRDNTATRLEDFDRRLSLLEAKHSLAGAMAAGNGQASVNPAASANTPPSANQAVSVGSAPAGSHVVLTSPPSTLSQQGNGARETYRVQAASPGLALLAQVDLGGGNGAQLQVIVGDTIPGYGRVLSIGQRGTDWVVTTNNGIIQ